MSQDIKVLKNVISIDDSRARNHMDNLVRSRMEETLNAMLDAEADAMCKAQHYECNTGKIDTCAGSYEQQLHTKTGEVMRYDMVSLPCWTVQQHLQTPFGIE